ncbi:MAG: aspartate/glutamate racemase family protein [Chloroflexi bacterium]|nr:aspartate/glutamate racemase family protein [Chloroflexota bacterium]
MRAIGIVGGVGPFAGLDLQRKIAEQTVAQRDQDHLTVLSVSRPSPIPDRTQYLTGQVEENPARALANQVHLLAKMGATVVGIPCNTAHAPPIFDLLRVELETALPPTKLLHMIQEVGRFLQTHFPYVKRVGILSTTGTYQTKLYPQLLEPLGFDTVIPSPQMQETQIHPAIYHPTYGIKSCGVVTEQARHNLTTGVATLQGQGAEAIILGCTEIPLAITNRQIDSTIIIDPTLILARALIREVDEMKLRPW